MLAYIIKCAFLAFVIVFPCMIIYATVKSTPKNREEAVRKAVEMNHVVTARRVNIGLPVDLTSPRQRDRMCTGFYEYEYQGKKYKYRLSADEPPYEITLYFLNDPKKAGVSGEIAVSNVRWGIIWLILFLVMLLIYK